MIIGRNAVGFHLNLAGTKVTIDPDLGDIRQTPLLSDRVLIHDMLGLPYKEKTPFEVRQSTGLENALAVIYERKRYIVYDPRWVGGDTFDARVLVLAHEIGHHLCKHTEGKGGSDDWVVELEADAVAGSIIRRMEKENAWTMVPLRDAIKGAQLLDEAGSPTHPPRNLRIKAILDGYNNGHKCSGR